MTLLRTFASRTVASPLRDPTFVAGRTGALVRAAEEALRREGTVREWAEGLIEGLTAEIEPTPSDRPAVEQELRRIVRAELLRTVNYLRAEAE